MTSCKRIILLSVLVALIPIRSGLAAETLEELTKMLKQ
jgi:hypothetical protein